MAAIIDRKRFIEAETGFPIDIIEDNTLENVSAVSQMALET